MMRKITLLLFLGMSLVCGSKLHAQTQALTLKVNLLAIPQGDVILEADYQMHPHWSLLVGLGVRTAHVDMNAYRFFNPGRGCWGTGAGVYVGSRYIFNAEKRGVWALKPVFTYQQFSIDPIDCGEFFPQGYTFYDRTVDFDLLASYSYHFTEQLVLEAALGLGFGIARDSRLFFGWEATFVNLPAQLSLGYIFGK